MRKRCPVAQLKEKKMRHYLAFVGDNPAGTGSIVVSDGVASVWNVGTLDQYRNRGVATCLMQHMLADARQLGSDVAMLFSTAQGYNFFVELGFDIFTQRQWFLPQNIEYEHDGESVTL
jgi:N-acetylglutamate synthase-like GNAT family acetyltransferase